MNTLKYLYLCLRLFVGVLLGQTMKRAPCLLRALSARRRSPEVLIQV